MYENSNISEMNTKEIEQVDIKAKVDITPSETISSRKPFNTTEQVNYRKEIEKINLEREANIKVKIDNKKEIEAIAKKEVEQADIKAEVDISHYIAPIQGQDNFLSSNAFSRIQADQEMILFDVTSFDTKDFVFDLSEVNQGIQTGLNSSCDAIISMNKQCTGL